MIYHQLTKNCEITNTFHYHWTNKHFLATDSNMMRFKTETRKPVQKVKIEFPQKLDFPGFPNSLTGYFLSQKTGRNCFGPDKQLFEKRI